MQTGSRCQLVPIYTQSIYTCQVPHWVYQYVCCIANARAFLFATICRTQTHYLSRAAYRAATYKIKNTTTHLLGGFNGLTAEKRGPLDEDEKKKDL